MLVSYPYMRDMYKTKPNIPSGFSEVIIDSGGYQLQTGAAEVYLKAYGLWLELLLAKHPEVIGYMNLDILSDPVKTQEHQFYLESQRLKPIPTWHDGEGEDYLDYYCRHYPWVSIGGLMSKSRPGKSYMVKLVNRIMQSYPDTNFHLFGVGISGVKAYQQMRPYSCDFSTWSTVARFGHTIVKDPKQIIKEVQLPKEDRDRLRVDSEYQKELTRQAIQNIKYYEETINSMVDTDHQLIMGI